MRHPVSLADGGGRWAVGGRLPAAFLASAEGRVPSPVFIMIRLIAIDLDGTLLDSRGHLPGPNRDAIAEAVARGFHVTLVTGRSFHFARPVVSALPSEVTLVVNNGAVEKTMDGATLARRLLSIEAAQAVLDGTRAHRASAALVFDRDDRPLVFETMDWDDPNRRGYFERNRAYVSQAPLDAALDEAPIAVVFNGRVEPMRELRERLLAWPAAGAFAVALTEYEQRDFSLVDVTGPDCTKATGLASRATALGIDASEVLALGDNFNDAEMLEWSGLPVLMGNAVPGLRARGWATTGTNDEAGVAQAIRRYALQTG